MERAGQALEELDDSLVVCLEISAQGTQQVCYWGGGRTGTPGGQPQHADHVVGVR